MQKTKPPAGAQQHTASDAPPLPFRRRGGFKPMGHFAYKTLEAILKLKERAYGFAIHEDLCNEFRAIIDPAQIYVACRRLKEQHYVTSRVVAAPSTRHMVKRYRITKTGVEALSASRAFYAELANKGENSDAQTEETPRSRRTTQAKRTRGRGA